MSSSAFIERPKIFCTRPSNWLYVQNWHKQVFFLGPRKFRILQIFKPPFIWLGSYERQSLLSRNSCLVPDSGSMPKWVPPSSLLMGWNMPSTRKGSWAIGRPFHMYQRLTLSRPRKNLKFSRSSFQTSPTSVCPFMPMEQQGIPCTHCCSPPNHRSKVAAQEV